MKALLFAIALAAVMAMVPGEFRLDIGNFLLRPLKIGHGKLAQFFVGKLFDRR